MDALSDILRVARLSGGVFFNAEFSAPWCIAAQMAPELCAPFLGATNHLIPYHYVVDGEMHVALSDQPAQRLRSGEIVLFPRNDFHLIGSDVSLHPVSACYRHLGRREQDRSGGSPRRWRRGGPMVCGFLGCDSGLTTPIVSTLPPSMILTVDETPAADWIRSTLQYAANEVAGGQTGSTAVLSKLSELLFVEAVQHYVRSILTGKPAGSPDCAIPPFPGHWRSCTQTSPMPGASRSSRARPDCPARASPKGSPG